ncbi:MAG: hypothetical protein HY068_03815 [Burkholderiales bacterium]|nr:hypothetical protein [Burkholderiales bacterium]
MEKIIVYLDDAEFARHQLMPMKNGASGSQQGTHWILVACPPRMTRHISKWVNHSARQNWRNKWAEKLFALITPELQAQGDKVTTVLANGPLVEQTQELLKQQGVARVLDARRPKFGQDLPPVTADQPASSEARWTVPGAIVGMGAALVLAAE